MIFKKNSKHLETLRAVQRLTDEQGYPPTLREMGEALGVSSTSAESRLASCQAKDLLKRLPNKSRSIHLTAAGLAAIKAEMPTLGSPAGKRLLSDLADVSRRQLAGPSLKDFEDWLNQPGRDFPLVGEAIAAFRKEKNHV